MDAFYASIEQRDFPEFRGKPVAVGGSKKRGVIAAASYEARKYGVKSAMSSALAVKKCPKLIFCTPRFEIYRSVSHQIREIFFEYTDLVEPLSLDEAYLDVTDSEAGQRSATLLAKEITDRIHEQTQLTASAGVSYNKFLAKTASDVNKPNGIFTITPQDALTFIDTLPIGRFYGIGKVSEQKMKNLGIHNGKDLRDKELQFLLDHFGKAGKYYYNIARGIDNRAVNTHRIRKSIGAERTFDEDLKTMNEYYEALTMVIDKLWPRIEKNQAKGKQVTLKYKHYDFTVSSKNKTFVSAIDTRQQLEKVLFELLDQHPPEKPIRLIGASLAKLVDLQNRQLTIKFP